MKKKQMIILIVVAIVLAIGGYFLNKIKSKPNVEFEQNDTYELEAVTTKKVDNRNKYYAVYNIAKDFVDNMMYRDSETLINVIDGQYLKDNNLNSENISTKLESIYGYDEDDEEMILIVENMYYYEKSSNINIYFLEGYTRNKRTSEMLPFNVIIETDSKNGSYVVLPKDYMEKNNYLNMIEGKEINIDVNEIGINDNNKFTYVNIQSDTIVMDYLARFKEYVLYNKEKAYNMLDEDYKTKRFGSYEAFQEYLTKNISRIFAISFEQYAEKEVNGLNQYICVDQNGIYYVINEKSIMNFSLMLDSYTIGTADTTETYKNSTDTDKVVLNIKKIAEAINTKDYQYIYNHLNETFKQANFATYDVFKTFMESNFFNVCKLKVMENSVQSDIYVYKLNFINVDDESKIIIMNVNMRLTDDGFEMSFGQ